VHDDRRVDERAGGGHVLFQQAFQLVRAQADGQVEQLHRPGVAGRKEQKKKKKKHNNDTS